LKFKFRSKDAEIVDKRVLMSFGVELFHYTEPLADERIFGVIDDEAFSQGVQNIVINFGWLIAKKM
jgi:hypothetical protein